MFVCRCGKLVMVARVHTRTEEKRTHDETRRGEREKERSVKNMPAALETFGGTRFGRLPRRCSALEYALESTHVRT